jgi:uncharacterized protein (DUF362 family)
MKRLMTVVVALLLAAGGMISMIAMNSTTGINSKVEINSNVEDKYSIYEKPNLPIGTAKGIYPGRVVWIHDPKVAQWDEKTGFWWEDKCTDIQRVEKMTSLAICKLTGKKTNSEAWKAMFEYFNQKVHGKKRGYQKGEKVLIKINMNTARESDQADNKIHATPQAVLVMVRQLVEEAHVPAECISILDCVRHITDNIVDPVWAKYPGVKFYDATGERGRIKTTYTKTDIVYSVTENNKMGTGIATCQFEADYIINQSLLKGHNVAGITLCAKNHYGSVNGRDHFYIRQYERGPANYNPLVDIMGYKHFEGKTLLFMIDGIWGAKDADRVPETWKMDPFNGAFPASIFVSLDNVALESVGYDLFAVEISDRPFIKFADSYLHEAALASDPPSGVKYAPNGIPLQSLGVHEHWNNPHDRQYSGNLGKKGGIELIYINPVF